MSSTETTTSKFEEKANLLVANINTLAGNSKVPAWIKPFFETVKGFVKDVTDAFNDLEGSLKIQQAVTNGLSKDREGLLERLETVNNALQDQLQYSRRNMILIHGIEEKQGHENTDDIAMEVFEKAKVKIEKKDINRSYRLGKRNKDRKRPIIVSFCSYRDKKSRYTPGLQGTRSTLV